ARAPAAEKPEPAVFSGRLIWLAALAAVLLLLAVGFVFHRQNEKEVLSKARFVGSEICSGCHQAEAKSWGISQHQAAMQHATERTVLGDFRDAGFDYYGVHSRFYRENGKFLVET